MQISPTEAFQPAADSGAGFLLVFLDEEGEAERWLLLDGGGVAARGEAPAPLPEPGVKLALAVPGTQVAIHWLELDEGLTQAQAAAAARLMLADACAGPIAETHVAVGRPERGLTPVAFVASRLMALWLERFEARSILPTHLLLPVPDEGLVRHGHGPVSDYRGLATAFTLEPELAEMAIDGAEVAELGEAGFEAALAPVLAAPPLDLRQGNFARRRRWRGSSGKARRIGWLLLALALVSLVVEVATILAYTFAADRLETEARALDSRSGSAGVAPAFGATAALLFEAVRATPNVELTRIEYRPDGRLEATVTMDSRATLVALRSRLEASGLSVEPGAQRSAGGRPTADLIVRPS